MKLFFILCIFLMLLKDTLGAPATRTELDPELAAGYAEGDMVLSPQQRNGLRDATYRWPDGIVYYRISSSIDQAHRNQILIGLNKIELSSCLVFKEASLDQKYYVNITSEPGGCYTAVGFLNRVQQMNLQNDELNKGCYRMGTIMHEMLHALGFYHQQSASDRDDYVRIAVENIVEGKEHNFEKYEAGKVDNFDQTYDYGSVMHYTPYGFSKNGEMTIVPREADAEKIMGQRLEMSQRDINKLNIMYKCPRHT